MDPAPLPPPLLEPSLFLVDHCDCCGFPVSGRSERAIQAALYDHATAVHGGPFPARPQ